MNKVCIYTRVSTFDQKTDLQLDDLKKYCIANEFEYELYEDMASGSKTEGRPEFLRMMASARNGDFKKIIIWKLDRLSRNMRDFLNTFYELDSLGIELISLKDHLDFSTPAGKMMANMLGVFAQFESDLCRQRTRAGMAAAKARGKKMGPPEKLLDAYLLRQLLAAKKSFDEIAIELGFSKSHLYRKIRREYGSIRMLRVC